MERKEKEEKQSTSFKWFVLLESVQDALWLGVAIQGCFFSFCVYSVRVLSLQVRLGTGICDGDFVLLLCYNRGIGLNCGISRDEFDVVGVGYDWLESMVMLFWLDVTVIEACDGFRLLVTDVVYFLWILVVDIRNPHFWLFCRYLL